MSDYQDELLATGIHVPLTAPDAVKGDLMRALDVLMNSGDREVAFLIRSGRFESDFMGDLLVLPSYDKGMVVKQALYLLAGDTAQPMRVRAQALRLEKEIDKALEAATGRSPPSGADLVAAGIAARIQSPCGESLSDPKVTEAELAEAMRHVGSPKLLVERPHRDFPLVVSYGLGVDSTALLVGLAQLVAQGREEFRPSFITFGDTGAERRETYDYLQYMNKWLRGVGFPEVVVCAYQTGFKSGSYGTSLTLEQQALVNHTMPSISQSKFGRAACSKLWKQQAQNTWFKEYSGFFERAGRSWQLRPGVPGVLKAIGFDASEGSRETRGTYRTKDDPDARKNFYAYWYPLRDWGWNRARCLAEIKAARIGPYLPKKSSCYFCGASRPEEIREIGREAPDLLRRAILVEEVAKRSDRRRIPAWLVNGFAVTATRERIEALSPLREKYLRPWLDTEEAALLGVRTAEDVSALNEYQRKKVAKWLRDNRKGIPQRELMGLEGNLGNHGLGVKYAWSDFALSEGLLSQSDYAAIVAEAQAIIAEAPRLKGSRDAATGPVLSATDAFSKGLGFRWTGQVWVPPEEDDADVDEDEDFS